MIALVPRAIREQLDDIYPPPGPTGSHEIRGRLVWVDGTRLVLMMAVAGIGYPATRRLPAGDSLV